MVSTPWRTPRSGDRSRPIDDEETRPMRTRLALALPFLAAAGFPSGTFAGVFGPHVDWALRRFQLWARLHPDGVAGPSTLAALSSSPPSAPLPLAWPLVHPAVGDLFGPRGTRFHTGVDLVAPAGTPVYAARAGRVVYADWADGGWGFLVI